MITPCGSTTSANFEPVDPLGFRATPSEGSLPAEQPLAACPHSHDGRNEGRVHHVVDGRRLPESSGEVVLQDALFGLQGTDTPVELALGAEGGEVGAQVQGAQVQGGEAPEVPLAAEARPLLGEYSECQNLAFGEQCRVARFPGSGQVTLAPPVVDEHVQ